MSAPGQHTAAVRDTAVRVLRDVLDTQVSLTHALSVRLCDLTPRQHSLAKELCYGVLRWLPRLEYRLQSKLTKPLRKRDLDVKLLLLLGLYQIEFTRIPDHAAVSETVAAASRLRKPWAKGLINATLRASIGSERTDSEMPEDFEFAHPSWLLERLRQRWPGDWQAIVRANNARAPMTIRVNAMQDTRAQYLARLSAAGIEAHATTYADAGLTLETPCEVSALPGFATGAVSVQDEASQLAATLLACEHGHKVLDACAAPGGKTAHLLERSLGQVDLTAVDVAAQRVARIEENLTRLALSARVVCADILDTDQWWDGQPFDRILLDAPCSATGVIRRHPDIKWLRRDSDIDRLSHTQSALLETLWPSLATGGLLLYATCSILPEENQQPVERFIETHEDAAETTLAAPWGRATQPGNQIFPGAENMDGFFYALIEKR